MNRIWIEINKQNLKQNIDAIRKLAGLKVKIAPCVKGNAYGHGLVEISKLLEEFGADWLSIDNVKEAEQLRQNRIKTPFLITGPILEHELETVVLTKSSIFLYQIEIAKKLNAIAAKQNKIIPVHIKVDTGMGRQGILPNETFEFFKSIQNLKHLKIEGIASHFALTDFSNPHYHHQKEDFYELKKKLSYMGFSNLFYHLSKSGSILKDKSTHYNFVRPGIITYGLYPNEQSKKFAKLKPVLSLKTRVAGIKALPKDFSIGYGATYKTSHPTQVALLPIGYYEGLDRKLSNNGRVLINGQYAPILGRICMDMTMVDVTEINNVQRNDEVVIIGKQRENEITVDQIAQQIGTINYEVITRLNPLLNRIFV